MTAMESYEKYPVWIVVLSNLVSLAIYGLGIFILFQLGWLAALVFLLYIIILEIRLIRNHCVDCYYRGKTCGFGKGKLSSWVFKQGDASKFCYNEMTWKDMIPDILVWIVPFIVGIIVLIVKFNLIVLIALILLFLFSTFGNAFIRGSLVCKYCKQRAIGCPAEKLFNK